jgi:hypothetical protein
MFILNFETYFNEFSVTQDRAFEHLSRGLEKQVCLFRNYFDSQQKLFLNHYPGPRHYFEDYETIILQAYWKCTHLSFSVNQLILHGEYGSARIIMRHIFEFLILAKYMYLTKDNFKAHRWLKGGQFDLYDNVIKQLHTPDKKNFHDLWIMFSQLVHAGTGSVQVGLSKEIDDDVLSSFYINLLLLCCKNILLQKLYITSKLEYISERYGNYHDENKEIRKQIRSHEKEIKKQLPPLSLSVIRDYRKNWEFKSKMKIN